MQATCEANFWSPSRAGETIPASLLIHANAISNILFLRLLATQLKSLPNTMTTCIIIFTELLIKYNTRQPIYHAVIVMGSLTLLSYTLSLTKTSQGATPLGTHFWANQGAKSN